MEEATFAKRLVETTKVIQAAHLVVAALAVAALAVLRLSGVLQEWWVVPLPILQHWALSMIIGGYFGARIAPRVIDEQRGE
jgi:uncharacterized membrane protein YfcA